MEHGASCSRAFKSFLAAICLFAQLPVHQALSEPLSHVPATRRLRSVPNQGNSYYSGADSNLDRLLEPSGKAFDPLSLMTLRRMQAEAGPAWDPAGVDPDLSRDAAEKAFALQAGHSLSTTLRSSDLRQTYKDVVSTLFDIQSLLRASLTDTGGSYAITKRHSGKKLVELGFEFSFRRIIEPQLRIGGALRLRYDHRAQRPLVEYSFSF